MMSRPYDPERDKEAVLRIWREIGWLTKGKEPSLDTWLEGNRAFVAELNGSAECAVTVGEEPRAEPGTHGSLPTLTASVNALSRLWLGVRPASGLAITDDLAGPPALLAELDTAFRLPPPKLDWEF